MLVPAEKAEALPQASRSDVQRHPSGFDQNGRGAAQGVHEGPAGSETSRPAGAQQYPGGEGLLERRRHVLDAIAAAMQPAPCEVDADAQTLRGRVHVYADIRVGQIHRRTLSGGLTKLVDDGVFDLEGRKNACARNPGGVS